MDDLFSFAFSSYSIMDVSQPQCTSIPCEMDEKAWEADGSSSIRLLMVELSSG
jgi:hypothetical protein